MKMIRKLSGGILGIILGTSLFLQTYDLKLPVVLAAQNAAQGIRTVLDVSECAPKDTVTLSIYMQGGGIQEVSRMSGILEYDNRLFTVEKSDFLLAESENVKDWSFHPSGGTFDVQYHSGIAIPDGGLIMQIKLHAAPNVPAGKTTFCVSRFGWQSSDSTDMLEMEHRIPVQLIIQTPEMVLGDVNGDGNINLTDASLIMQYYNGIQELNSNQLQNADVNNDGSVNLVDVRLIMKYYNKEIQNFQQI